MLGLATIANSNSDHPQRKFLGRPDLLRWIRWTVSGCLVHIPVAIQMPEVVSGSNHVLPVGKECEAGTRRAVLEWRARRPFAGAKIHAAATPIRPVPIDPVRTDPPQLTF